jgi:hypothetical protein
VKRDKIATRANETPSRPRKTRKRVGWVTYATTDFFSGLEGTWKKFTGKRDGSLWYYTALLAEYRRLGVSKPLVEELARTVATMRELAGGGSE